MKQTLATHYSDLDDTISLRPRQRSEFTGGGLQIGLESSWEICRGFSVVGDFAGSVFVGNQKRHVRFASIAPAVGPNFQRIKTLSKTQVVPAVDARLGLSYCFSWCSSIISLEVGYRAGVYFNAVQSVHPGSLVVGTGTVTVATMDETISNFNYSGPYLAATVDF